MPKKWSSPPATRQQLQLFGQSLDELVGVAHPIRLLDELLLALDWSDWEAKYTLGLGRGQPPIHPRLLAGAILYGLMKRIRSSRDLEEATCERKDFIWFLEGRTIDHSTFASFRTRFGTELKGLNKQIAGLLFSAGRKPLLELAIDGTRIRSNSARQGARSAERLAEQIARCEASLNGLLDRLDGLDEEPEADPDESVESLEARMEKLERQRAKLYTALDVAKARDAKKKISDGNTRAAVRVPLTDPDSVVLPNKDGGHAPNYTPVVSVEAESGAVVSCDVVEGADEAGAVLPALEEAEGLTGQKVERVLADGAFGTGPNLAELESRQTEACMHPDLDFRPGNPAIRDDPSQPVAEEQWDQLPRCGKKLSRSCFVYDVDQDCYFCPLGRRLEPGRSQLDGRSGTRYVRYRCADGASCPLAAHCLGSKSKNRTIRRDEYQASRERLGKRMATEESQEVYKKRAPIVEGVFGVIKHNMGIRQFLLRGRDKVRTEWDWICGAFNLGKLLRAQAAVRQAAEAQQALNGAQRGDLRPFRRLQALWPILARWTLGARTRRFEGKRRPWTLQAAR